MQSQQKMGTMRMGPLIFSMALPAMISMLINALYNIVDSIFVARYSASALTAVSLVFPLQQLVIAIAVGTGVGVNSLIARCLGAKDQEKADNAAEHGVVLSCLSCWDFWAAVRSFPVLPRMQLSLNRRSAIRTSRSD